VERRPFLFANWKTFEKAITEVVIQFKPAPHKVFRGESTDLNCIVLNIQPDEGISLSFGAKAPEAKCTSVR